MNRVQTVTQKHHRVENRVRCTSTKTGTTGPQARAGLVESWPGLALSWSRALVVSQLQAAVSQRSPARPCTPCRTRRATRPCSPCLAPLCAVSCVSQASQRRIVAQCRAPAPCRGRVHALLCALCCASCSPGTLYRDTVAQPPSHFGHNTLLYCDTIWPPAPLSSHNTKHCIAIQFHAA